MEQEPTLSSLLKELTGEYKHWKYLKEKGGTDPFWRDGCNLNLTRNHIIWAKREIQKLCKETRQELPPEFYTPLPPECPYGYIAPGSKIDKRTLCIYHKFWDTPKKGSVNLEQGSLF